MISFGERCYSYQYDEIFEDEVSDDEISGFANTTSGIFSAPNHLSNKIVLSPKIFTNTYRMQLNLCQLKSVNVLLHIT